MRDIEEEQEQRLHLIVVRRDTQGFQHLHPRMDGDGRWSIPVTLPEAGSYLFADFQRGGEKSTLGADLSVDGPVDWQPLPAAASTARIAGGYEVTLSGGRSRAGRESELEFTVSRNGKPVKTEPYLGAGGHLVALRRGTSPTSIPIPPSPARSPATPRPCPSRPSSRRRAGTGCSSSSSTRAASTPRRSPATPRADPRVGTAVPIYP